MQLPLFQETYEPDADALARCLQAQTVALDIETDTRWPGRGPRQDYGLSYQADITVIALAWQEDSVLNTTVLAAPFGPEIRTFLVSLFAPHRLIIAHNAVFDLRQLSKLTGGLVPERIWDTQSMARLIHPAVDLRYNLLSVAAALGIAYPDRQQAMKSQRGKLHMLPLPVAMEYAQDDARLSLQIYLAQRELDCSPELIDWECRALREYSKMAATGIRLNIPFVESQLAGLGARRDQLVSRLRADGLATPGSAQARARYLHESKGIPLPDWDPKSIYFTRAGRRRLTAHPNAPVELGDLSTRADVIESYMQEGSPYLDQLHDIAAYMEVDWLFSTLRGLLDHAVTDGRLHSLVNIATDTGRRASSYPHMQNWKMPAMAGVAVGDEGFTLVEIDYRNAENVMAAMIASDSALAAACRTEDFHATMAEQYFGPAWLGADPSTRKHLRGMSKKITYGTAYGMGADRLGQSIGVSTDEARRLIRAKDRAFARVTKIRTAAQQRVRETGILRLWTGRPVAVPTDFVAWNYLCQGGVSEMLKRAIVVVAESYKALGLRSRVALDMHDALILEVAHEEWDAALSLASRIMSTITPDKFIQRTDPPILWVAQPDLAENRLKWGAQQGQPGG